MCVILGMKIYLVSLNVVHGERLYKRHFAFSFNESIFVLKRQTQEECFYRDVVVQQELCHRPLQGVAKWQHKSYGGALSLA